MTQQNLCTCLPTQNYAGQSWSLLTQYQDPPAKTHSEYRPRAQQCVKQSDRTEWNWKSERKGYECDGRMKPIRQQSPEDSKVVEKVKLYHFFAPVTLKS